MKHKDLIIAWANGAEIECWQVNDKLWSTIEKPKWDENFNYRIKPNIEKLLKDLSNYSFLCGATSLDCNTTIFPYSLYNNKREKTIMDLKEAFNNVTSELT